MQVQIQLQVQIGLTVQNVSDLLRMLTGKRAIVCTDWVSIFKQHSVNNIMFIVSY